MFPCITCQSVWPEDRKPRWALRGGWNEWCLAFISHSFSSNHTRILSITLIVQTWCHRPITWAIFSFVVHSKEDMSLALSLSLSSYFCVKALLANLRFTITNKPFLVAWFFSKQYVVQHCLNQCFGSDYLSNKWQTKGVFRKWFKTHFHILVIATDMCSTNKLTASKMSTFMNFRDIRK